MSQQMLAEEDREEKRNDFAWHFLWSAYVISNSKLQSQIIQKSF